MVERVAKAICAASGEAWREPPFNRLHTDALNNHWRHKAVAVIEAMYEPTDAMWKADGVHRNCPTCGGAGEQWPLLIDASLTPPTDE